VRNQQTLDFAPHYGVTVLTCQPADSATKGAVEASVKLAKDDRVPKDTNLRHDYRTFAQLDATCLAFMDEVNHRERRVTGRKPAAMLVEEAPRLHRVPDTAHRVPTALPARLRRTPRWSPSKTASTRYRPGSPASTMTSSRNSPKGPWGLSGQGP
jgi:hypothetical protein